MRTNLPRQLCTFKRIHRGPGPHLQGRDRQLAHDLPLQAALVHHALDRPLGEQVEGEALDELVLECGGCWDDLRGGEGHVGGSGTSPTEGGGGAQRRGVKMWAPFVQVGSTDSSRGRGYLTAGRSKLLGGGADGANGLRRKGSQSFWDSHEGHRRR